MLLALLCCYIILLVVDAKRKSSAVLYLGCLYCLHLIVKLNHIAGQAIFNASQIMNFHLLQVSSFANRLSRRCGLHPFTRRYYNTVACGAGSLLIQGLAPDNSTLLTRSFAKKKKKSTKKKKPKKIDYNKKYDPELLKRLLEKTNAKLEEAEKEPLGKDRGRAAMRKRLCYKEDTENPREKKFLLKLLFERHALMHGKRHLIEMDKEALSKSFLGEETTSTKISLPLAKHIILELWRYGKSNMLELQRNKDLEKQEKLQRKEREIREGQSIKKSN